MVMNAAESEAERTLRPAIDPSLPLRTLIVLSAAAFLATAYLMSFLCDDAFIAFRYSRNLVEHGALVYNLGEYVEGYTSLGWVLAMAAGMLLGMTPELFSRALGIAAGLGVIAVTARHTAKTMPGRLDALTGAVTGTALCLPLAVWSTGGLEASAFTLLWALGIFGTLRTEGAGAWRSGLWLAATALTRPEGLLAIAVLGPWLAFEAARCRRAWRHVLLWGLAAGGPVLVHLCWRRWYYGDWVPNNYYVKSHMLDWQVLELGARYLLHYFGPYPLGFVGLLGVVLALARRERWAWPLVALIAVLILHVVTAGGDFMDLGRLLVPLTPLLAWALGYLVAHLPRTRLVMAGLVLVLAAHVGLSAQWAARSYEPWSANRIDSIGWLNRLCRQWTAIGKYLRDTIKPGETLMTTAAGAIPYYAGCYTVDQFGLVNRMVALEGHIRSPRPGHRKLLASRFGVDMGINYIIGHPELSYDTRYILPPEFQGTGYQPVAVRIPECDPPYWFYLYKADAQLTHRPGLLSKKSDSR